MNTELTTTTPIKYKVVVVLNTSIIRVNEVIKRLNTEIMTSM